MPKFAFIETEELIRRIEFEANNLEEATALMDEALSVDDLPNAIVGDWHGAADWTEPKETKSN